MNAWDLKHQERCLPAEIIDWCFGGCEIAILQANKEEGANEGERLCASGYSRLLQMVKGTTRMRPRIRRSYSKFFNTESLNSQHERRRQLVIKRSLLRQFVSIDPCSRHRVFISLCGIWSSRLIRTTTLLQSSFVSPSSRSCNVPKISTKSL